MEIQYGMAVKQGKFQAMRVTYRDGNPAGVVEPLGPFGTYQEAMACFTNEQVIAQIEMLQSVQKENPQTSAAWKVASRNLQPLFTEMARRTNG